MFTEPVQKKKLSQSATGNLSRQEASFKEIFERALFSPSRSRPPKIVVTGLLVPSFKNLGGHTYRYKLEADSVEYILSMNKTLESIAQKIEWEEVTVKGHFDLSNQILEVEKISVNKTSEALRPNSYWDDSSLDSTDYERVLALRGKLELAFDSLAS